MSVSANNNNSEEVEELDSEKWLENKSLESIMQWIALYNAKQTLPKWSKAIQDQKWVISFQTRCFVLTITELALIGKHMTQETTFDYVLCTADAFLECSMFS